MNSEPIRGGDDRLNSLEKGVVLFTYTIVNIFYGNLGLSVQNRMTCRQTDFQQHKLCL